MIGRGQGAIFPWLTLVVSLLVAATPATSADVSLANYASVVVRDGTLDQSYLGHAGVVIWPLYGLTPDSTKFIAQANGFPALSSYVSYSQFIGGQNNYVGHYRTYDSQWNSAAFRDDVVKFANQAMGKAYTLALYEYAESDTAHFPNQPYAGVVPTKFRCDG